ncbi:MAG: magnesium transporter [Candidatus Omnitrophica bacterium]|nr:magnesium transporter [Candidatus Omnitrophota bacterium]
MSVPSDLEKWKHLAQTDPGQAAAELGRTPSDQAQQIAKSLGVDCLAGMILRLGTDAAADLLRNLSEEFREKALREVPAEKSRHVREILSYPPGTAGALMAKEYLSVPIECDIGEAARYLRSLPQDGRAKVSYIYVVDRNHRLEGVIQVRDLVFYPHDRPVRDILRGPIVQVEAGMSQRDVARILQRHRYLGLPVVDKAQRLVGLISANNVLQVFEEEAEEDIARIVGTSAEEIKARSARKILRLRLPWMMVNLISGLLCALILGLFESSVETAAALFLFVPVVLGISESAGVQGATIIVRNLLFGNINLKDLSAFFFREALVGVALGVICGSLVGSAAILWPGGRRLGLAIAASMAVAVIFSALIGLALPLVFKRLRIDPAIASGPLVLAICDLQTLVVYFGISTLILAL